MEDRTMNCELNKPCSDALNLYASGISDLRTETMEIASDVLSRSPEYWNSNPEEASGLLLRLQDIELGESLLDSYKDIHCGTDK